MTKLSVRDVDVRDKKVLVRVDFNVPLDENGNVSDDKRIQAALPTIKHLLAHNAAVVLMSHLGRPKGKAVPSMSLAPVAKRLGEILQKEIKFSADCVGSETVKNSAELKPGELLLLENLRFHPEEEKNDTMFAKKLAALGDIFVQDAFGTVHRAHASTEGIAKHLKAYMGFLLEKELKFLGDALASPARPFIAIIGGAKVSDKIELLDNLCGKVDALIVGGAMAYTFLLAKNIGIGNSLVETDKIELAHSILVKALGKKCRIILPMDHLIATKVEKGAENKITDTVEIPEGWTGVDIGPMSLSRIAPIIIEAKALLWNGPVGVFEIDEFAKGTLEVAKLIASATKKGATSIIGGGDSISAVKKAGVADMITHISTGGGASLEFLGGKPLPGVEVISEK